MPKPKRRILKSIRISEIACVDSPAHEGARMVMMKGAPDESEIAKQAMLTGATDGHTHVVNCSSYNGEAYSGDTSGANTSSGQYHTHPWVMSEDASGNESISIGENMGHTHDAGPMSKGSFRGTDQRKADAKAGVSLPDGSYPISSAKDLTDAVHAWGRANEADRGAVAKHIKRRAKALGLADKLPTDGMLADAMGKADDTASRDGDDAMSDQKQQPSAEDRAKAAEVEVQELKKKLTRQEALSSLNDQERSFSKSLPEAQLDAFLAAKPEQRKAELAKAQDADPVVYTDLEGVEYRKSEAPKVLALAKKFDAMSKASALAEAKVREQDYAKRAEQYSHLPGATDGGSDPRVDLLKAVDTIADEAKRARVVELVKAADAAMAPAFRSIGKAGGKLLNGSADDKLEALAKQYAKDHKTDFAKAYRAVMDTDEGKALYDQVNVRAVS